MKSVLAPAPQCLYGMKNNTHFLMTGGSLLVVLAVFVALGVRRHRQNAGVPPRSLSSAVVDASTPGDDAGIVTFEVIAPPVSTSPAEDPPAIAVPPEWERHRLRSRQQQVALRQLSRKRPNDVSAQALLAPAMRDAIASHNTAQVASLRQDINWIAGMHTNFRNELFAAQVSSTLLRWVAAHDPRQRPSPSWIRWAMNNLRQR